MRKFDKLMQEMLASAGGVFGDMGGADHGPEVENTDWYAPGDARLPKVLGAKKSKKKDKIPMFRRNLPPKM